MWQVSRSIAYLTGEAALKNYVTWAYSSFLLMIFSMKWKFNAVLKMHISYDKALQNVP